MIAGADEAGVERARVLADAFDAGTLRWLSRCARLGHHSLLLGPGLAPIANWLEQRAPLDARVTQLDINPRSWCQVTSDSPQVPASVIHDLTSRLGTFDLVHARFALVHAQNKDEILAALVASVRPGGVLVLEEPDFGSARALTGPDRLRQSFNNVQNAMEMVFSTLGFDHAVGSRIPALLLHHGFANVAIENDAAIVPGRAPLAEVMAMSATELATAFVATGFASLNDIERYQTFATDPACWATYVSIIRGVGERPLG